MQQELPLKFGGCIFDHFEIPKDNQWIFDLIDKYAGEPSKNQRIKAGGV